MPVSSPVYMIRRQLHQTICVSRLILATPECAADDVHKGRLTQCRKMEECKRQDDNIKETIDNGWASLLTCEPKCPTGTTMAPPSFNMSRSARVAASSGAAAPTWIAWKVSAAPTSTKYTTIQIKRRHNRLRQLPRRVCLQGYVLRKGHACAGLLTPPQTA